MTDYKTFLTTKRRTAPTHGRTINETDVHPMLHPWQRRIVTWAVQRGRAAIWADTGLGKSFMQIEWSRLSGDRTLIVAPLAVCDQTVREAAKLGIKARYVRSDTDAEGPGMWVTNYEMALRFDPALLDSVVLDEASILKQSDGKTRTALIHHFRDVKHRLACTATPAPNDNEELTSQAEFVGAMPRAEMLAAYFVHDDEGWRIKGHARGPMFRWMASWAVAIRRPSDIGYLDDGYALPRLSIESHLLPVDIVPEDQLFATGLGGVGGRSKIRKATLDARVGRAVRLVTDGSQAVHAPVRRSEPEQVSAHTGAAGAIQRAPTRGVREGSGSAGRREKSGEGIPRQSAPAPAGDHVQPDRGSTGDDARRGMLDLPCEPVRGRNGEATCGSRSSDGGHAGSALSAMQSGARPPMRRPDSGNGDVRLHHAPRDQWLVWCGLNAEQDAVAKALGSECVSIDGRTPLEQKITLEREWREGRVRVLISKPDVFMFGMNWQHCARMVFVGLSDSYESYYQCIRRCWRYGQTQDVEAHIVLSELEGRIADNVHRKERQAADMISELVREMRAAGELRMS